MYEVNFDQQSNCENLYQDWQLMAEDDGTPIQNSECVINLQIWARSPRGSGDQSQSFGYYNFAYATGQSLAPIVSASTNDNSGILTLNEGILELNVPLSIMTTLLPGYYEVGLTIQTIDGQIVQQLAVGTLPIYNGGVWLN